MKTYLYENRHTIGFINKCIIIDEDGLKKLLSDGVILQNDKVYEITIMESFIAKYNDGKFILEKINE